MAVNKYVVSDELWSRIEPLIPARNNTHPRGGGRKPRNDRQVFDSILFVLRFGIQWNALNAAGLCPSSTVHDRFKKWRAEGFFHRLNAAGLLAESPLRTIDWSWVLEETVAPLSTSGHVKFTRPREPRRQGGSNPVPFGFGDEGYM